MVNLLNALLWRNQSGRKKDSKSLQTQKANKIDHKYNFDITKANKIFKQQFNTSQLKFIGDNKWLSLKEIIGEQYCKWHNFWSHTTNSCVIFKN